MKQVMIVIRKRPAEVVVVTENYGGFRSGKCFACGASGWLDGLGYPAKAKAPGSHLQHEKNCPMNRVLDDKGDLRKPKK